MFEQGKMFTSFVARSKDMPSVRDELVRANLVFFVSKLLVVLGLVQLG